MTTQAKQPEISPEAIDGQTPPAEAAVPVQEVTETVVATQVAAVNETPVLYSPAIVETEADATTGEPEVASDDPQQEMDEPADEATEEPGNDGDISTDEFDFAGRTKAELVEIFAAALGSRPVQSLRREADALKVAFYKLHRTEVDQARARFVEEGGAEEEFIPVEDADELKFKELQSEYRKRRNEYLATQERSKEDNLKVKLQIIEQLKELVSGSETMNQTFNAFRELQQRWKDAGPVPQANVKDLWETYNLHVENFYDYVKINKELRDLDLKRNLEAKTALTEEAEALILMPSVVAAFQKLQKLHEQWREIGPVANEYKDVLWERFREASGRVNKAHQDYFERLKDEQRANLDLKSELCAKAEQLAETPHESRKEWDKASNELLEIQKVWKTIGYAPKKDNAKVYERFRRACDRFFEQKRDFYAGAKSEMEHNLTQKNQLCEAAEALQTSEDWKAATDAIIDLQRRWKEVGPVARRHSDAVWKRFRAACDKFFDRKSAHFSSQDGEHETNLAKKRELLSEINAVDVEGIEFDVIKEFQRRWGETGFVPIKQKDAVQKEYREAMDRLFAALRGNEQSRGMERFKGKVADMKSSGAGNGKLRHERERLYNKVKQMEADIALLENNIGFFSHSKNAEKMIRDVEEKIERTRREMAETVEKIRLIDSQE